MLGKTICRRRRVVLASSIKAPLFLLAFNIDDLKMAASELEPNEIFSSYFFLLLAFTITITKHTIIFSF